MWFQITQFDLYERFSPHNQGLFTDNFAQFIKQIRMVFFENLYIFLKIVPNPRAHLRNRLITSVLTVFIGNQFTVTFGEECTCACHGNCHIGFRLNEYCDSSARNSSHISKCLPICKPIN